jgi:hypothetical protein
MASIINGFQPIEWFRGLWGGSRTPAVVQTPPPVPEPGETRQPEQTGPQAAAGTYGFGWCEEIRGTPSGYRQMLRVPSLALVSGSFAAALLAGSWSVEADDDAPRRKRRSSGPFSAIARRCSATGCGASTWARPASRSSRASTKV